MPAWPTLYPQFLTYKTEIPVEMSSEKQYFHTLKLNYMSPKFLKHTPLEVHYHDSFHIPDRKLQMLYECEEERLVYKACLREVLTLKKSEKHTSWKTADVSALYLV